MDDLEASNLIIRAYDDSKKPVVGTFKAAVTVGEIESIVEFTVLDIPPTFALLLGRPWFHPLGGVPSTVHQKIKFPLNGKVVTIQAEANSIIACMNVTPPAFQVTVINEDWAGPKVAAMMKNMHYTPGTGLGKKQNGVSEMPEFKGQTSKQGLGYDPAKDKGKQTVFVSENSLIRYKGQPEEWESNGIKKPGFEIFADVIASMDKGKEQEEEEITVAQIEQILKNVRLEAEAASCTDITAFIESSIDDILFDDVFVSDDVCTANLFESDDVLNTKLNVMKSNFAYLFDVYPDGDVHFIEPYMSIFDIHSIDTEPFNIGTDTDPRILHISKDVTPEERRELEKILIKYSKVFTWTYDDMPGIDRDIAQYYIPTKEGCKPVKQKLRRLRPEWAQLVKEDIAKQIKAKFLEVVDYPEWLANVVPVPKKDGKVRVCVDYRDLNKACPKDDFPLPHIDVLIDNAAACAMYFFYGWIFRIQSDSHGNH